MKDDRTSQQYMFERVQEIIRDHLANEQEESMVRVIKKKEQLEHELNE
jgi:hypothetical protein